MKKIAIILSGCGVFDGSEIHEATLTMLAITKQQASYTCYAPNINQHHVINHITGKEMDQQRNVLIESSRIARGKILDLKKLDPNNFDAVVFPGGFGVAKNLSNFAFKGNNCNVNSEIESVVKDFWKAKKPIGALCISPAIIAKILPNLIVTIGNDKNTITEIEKMGTKHQVTNHGEITIDTDNKIVTSPCYMLDANILQIEQGINNLITKILEIV